MRDGEDGNGHPRYRTEKYEKEYDEKEKFFKSVKSAGSPSLQHLHDVPVDRRVACSGCRHPCWKLGLQVRLADLVIPLLTLKHHRWSFQLPQTLPGSIDFESGRRGWLKKAKAYIKYKFKATLDATWKKDLKEEQEVE